MHNLILGMTLSGKSTLGKALARVYRRQGFGVLVLDPVHDDSWPADFKTADPQEFLRVFWKSRQCMAFIDEAGDAVGKYNDVMNQTATKGRHCGHTLHYLAQRATQLPPLLRDQCTGLYLFASGKATGKVLAEEWNFPELENCHQLLTGEHFQARKMGTCKRVDMFNMRGKQNADSVSDSGIVNDGSRSVDAGQADEGDPEGNPEGNPED